MNERQKKYDKYDDMTRQSCTTMRHDVLNNVSNNFATDGSFSDPSLKIHIQNKFILQTFIKFANHKIVSSKIITQIYDLVLLGKYNFQIDMALNRLGSFVLNKEIELSDKVLTTQPILEYHKDNTVIFATPKTGWSRISLIPGKYIIRKTNMETNNKCMIVFRTSNEKYSINEINLTDMLIVDFCESVIYISKNNDIMCINTSCRNDDIIQIYYKKCGVKITMIHMIRLNEIIRSTDNCVKIDKPLKRSSSLTFGLSTIRENAMKVQRKTDTVVEQLNSK